MAAEWRITELERRLTEQGRVLSQAVARLAASEQLANTLAGGGGGGWNTGGGGGGIRVGLATSAITASNATTPGSGSAQPLKISGGVYANEGAAVTVRNAGAVISSGKRILILTDEDGVFWASPEEC